MRALRITRGGLFAFVPAIVLLALCLWAADLRGAVITAANLSPYDGFVPFMGSGAGVNLASLPSSLDLRNYNGADYVTSVKDQGSMGTCWAFAVYGALESDLLMSGGPVSDFSENNLANHAGFEALGPNDGGDESMAIAYMSRLAGPGLESDDPYVGYDNKATAPTTIPMQQFLTEADFYTTPSAMKNAIMTVGGLSTSLYYDFSGAFRASDDTYYYSGNALVNHAVVIVGWDDNKATAGGTGAWLCKNSWNTGFGDNGYFWLSYQDTEGGKYGASFVTTSPSAVSAVYTHAPHGEVGVVNSPLSCSVFQATQLQSLKSVGFYTQQDGAGYDIRVYNHWANGSPSGLLATVDGTSAYQGYHVVNLPSLVTLSAGESFVVYLGIANGGSYMQAIDYSYPGYCTSTAGPGQSFYSFDGATWGDLQTFDTTASFAVNAYTTWFAGDVNHDGAINAADIDAIYQHFGAAAGSQWKVAADGLPVGQQDVTYELNSYFHTVYGDATLAGKVGIDDFSVLLAHWGSTTAGWADGDFTGDGTVNIDDFSLLLSNWGWTSSNYQSMAQETPEPATLSLLALGGLALLRRKNPKR